MLLGDRDCHCVVDGRQVAADALLLGRVRLRIRPASVADLPPSVSVSADAQLLRVDVVER